MVALVVVDIQTKGQNYIILHIDWYNETFSTC